MLIINIFAVIITVVPKWLKRLNQRTLKRKNTVWIVFCRFESWAGFALCYSSHPTLWRSTWL